MGKESSYNFDEVISRIGTGSTKWEGTQKVFGSKSLLPLWVADTDFPVPVSVSEKIIERAKHPIYGYNTQEESLYQSLIAWIKARHNWEIKREWICTAPGVVPSIIFSILALSQPGDGVIIQPPIYPPFFASIKDNHRIVVENPLKSQNGYYQIDFEDLERKFSDPKNKLFLFCSPHNPVGRVWTKDELTQIIELAKKHDVIVLSDEIHSDLILSGHTHTVLSSLEIESCENVVTYFAASKTFNIAGLNTSFIVTPNSEQRQLIQNEISRLHLNRSNLFGVIATQEAYQTGEPWLKEVLEYIEENADVLSEFVRTRLPKVKVRKPEATYLAWLDFREYFKTSLELDSFLVNEAQVALNSGASYGSQGDGFARINLGTQKSVLLKALNQIEIALEKRSKNRSENS